MIFTEYFENMFGKKSVRIGRMKLGIRNYLYPEKHNEIYENLKDVFEREGYER